jgi:hypothetical protein
VQRNRRRELRERTQPPRRQPRRARRERVEMKHDERSRKADTEGTWLEPSPNRLRAATADAGKFPRGSAKSHATFLQTMATC